MQAQEYQHKTPKTRMMRRRVLMTAAAATTALSFKVVDEITRFAFYRHAVLSQEKVACSSFAEVVL